MTEPDLVSQMLAGPIPAGADLTPIQVIRLDDAIMGGMLLFFVGILAGVILLDTVLRIQRHRRVREAEEHGGS